MDLLCRPLIFTSCETNENEDDKMIIDDMDKSFIHHSNNDCWHYSTEKRNEIIENNLHIPHLAYLHLKSSPQTPKTLMEFSLETQNIKTPIHAQSLRRNRLFVDSSQINVTPQQINRPLVNINPYTPESMQAKRKSIRDAKRSRELSTSLDENNDDVDIPTKRMVLQESSISRYNKEFHEVCLIGKGTFGHVYKCINRLDGCIYAIKKSLKPVSGSRHEKNSLNEVYAHAVLGHNPHVVRYYSAWSEDGHMVIQNEFCNGGNLMEALLNRQLNNNHYTEIELKKILLHIAKGLKFMHDSNLVHMDIKPGNIFLSYSICNNSSESDEENHIEDDVIYKIGDLGHVTSICSPTVEEGDCRYLPKEILEENYCNLPKADIFALGLTLIESSGAGPLPKNGENWHALRKGIIPPLPKHNQEFIELLCLMIHPDPEQRPSSLELLQHKAINSLPSKNRSQLSRELDAEKLKNEILSRQLKGVANYLQCLKKTSKPKLLVGKACKKSRSTIF